jgi:glycosyltransferase involved in cell wall biosynthesis
MQLEFKSPQGEVDATSGADIAFRIVNRGLSAAGSNSKSQLGNRQPPRRPLRVMFLQTDMRVGGAEMLTANVIRRLDRDRFAPELCCLKERGALGESLADEIPVHHGLLRNKFDLRVWPRLSGLLRRRRIDAVITVGAGDKMFWGRLAARRVGVPVVLSALHSTGWPDSVGRLNRWLTPITDAFIAVAETHGRFLCQAHGFPADKVVVIPNGVDTDRFAPIGDIAGLRRELGIGAAEPAWRPLCETPPGAFETSGHVVGIVAALRPEKNHELFLAMAGRVARQLPATQFLIIGDGPRREALEQTARDAGLAANVVFLGSRDDVPRWLAAMDAFVLTSQIEANPVSILEAMSAGVPVVATNVGSIHEAVVDEKTGYLVGPGDADQLAEKVLRLLRHAPLRRAMGAAARQAAVSRWSIGAMVRGYERLIESVYDRKAASTRTPGNCEVNGRVDNER